MKRLYKFFTIALCLTSFAVACDNEDDDVSAFTGEDNYISSFNLIVGESRFAAEITADDIIIRTVEDRDLTGAEAQVSISENATIYPDPSQIGDWDDDHTFVVTSFSGSQRIYQYHVYKETAEPVKEGNFLLTTQTEVDDFGTLGVEILDGNLTIGRGSTGGEDPITSLSPLASLVEVRGIVTFQAGTPDNLSALEELKEAGQIYFPGGASFKTIIFPKLETVYGDFFMGDDLGAGSIKTVFMPQLVSVEGNFTMQWMGGISSFMVPKLRQVLGFMFIGGNGGMDQLGTLSLPSLEYVGGALRFYQFTGPKLECPVLKHCGGFSWEQSGHNLEVIEFPELEELMGTSVFQNMNGNSATVRVSMPKVAYIEDLTMNGMGHLETIELPSLKTVKNLTLINLPITSLNSFGSLETVEGTLTLRGLSNLEGFELPRSLSNLNTLAVSNLPGLNSLDLRGSGIKGVSVESSSSEPFELSADDTLEGSLTLNGTFILIGMKEVLGDVTITCPAVADGSAQIPDTEKIGGNFSLSCSGKGGIVSIPSLKEIGGTCYISSASQIAADNLETVGGTFTYDITMSSINGSVVGEFALPKLKSIAGDFTIYTWLRQTSPELKISMPSLTSVDGTLTLRHTAVGSAYGTSTVASNNVTTLDGFSSLTSLKGVYIWRQGQLNSLEAFRGLQNALGSITAENWQVANCGYNPTLEEMKNAKIE